MVRSLVIIFGLIVTAFIWLFLSRMVDQDTSATAVKVTQEVYEQGKQELQRQAESQAKPAAADGANETADEGEPLQNSLGAEVDNQIQLNLKTSAAEMLKDKERPFIDTQPPEPEAAGATEPSSPPVPKTPRKKGAAQPDVTEPPSAENREAVAKKNVQTGSPAAGIAEKDAEAVSGGGAENVVMVTLTAGNTRKGVAKTAVGAPQAEQPTAVSPLVNEVKSPEMSKVKSTAKKIETGPNYEDILKKANAVVAPAVAAGSSEKAPEIYKPDLKLTPGQQLKVAEFNRNLEMRLNRSRAERKRGD